MMKKLFSFKKMSTKVAFIIAAMVIVIGGAACAYMQTRIIEEIDTHSRLYVRYMLREAADDCNSAILGGAGDERLEDIVGQITLHDTGFALLADEHGEFYETNDFIRTLGASERSALHELAGTHYREAFDVRFGGEDYTAAHIGLHNDYSLFALMPRSEIMADVYASIMRFIIIFTVMVCLIIIVSRFIGKSMAAPLVKLNSYIKKAGALGDIALDDEDMRILSGLLQQKDEIGQCVGATVDFFKHVNNISEQLEVISNGDLATEVDVISDEDVLGKSLKRMVDNLNGMFAEINTATHRVATGSKQIADGSHALARGSTEQAASVQQLSASVADIAQKTKENSRMAEKAAMLANDIKGSAEKGSRQMDEMMAAVKDINASSHNISKVMKSIDDIAFQTNILALNAAVEAARAGQHGKGFAVVAEEVRNLAAKSADAAKDTESLIADSIEKADFGSKIADDTAASLGEIVAGINESNQLVSGIAKSSKEQTEGIGQINSGIDQVAQIVSQASATAEESAAASQEMSGQSVMLEELILRFKLKDADTPQQITLPAGRA